MLRSPNTMAAANLRNDVSVLAAMQSPSAAVFSTETSSSNDTTGYRMQLVSDIRFLPASEVVKEPFHRNSFVIYSMCTRLFCMCMSCNNTTLCRLYHVGCFSIPFLTVQAESWTLLARPLLFVSLAAIHIIQGIICRAPPSTSLLLLLVLLLMLSIMACIRPPCPAGTHNLTAILCMKHKHSQEV